MNIWCKLFGHKPLQEVKRYKNYNTKKLIPNQAIFFFNDKGSIHIIMNRCERCGAKLE